MISKVFKTIAVIMVRLAGIAFVVVAVGMLWKSIDICGNLAECLSPAAQLGISALKLVGLFFLNFIALLFDWCIAATLIVIAIGMILYKTETMDKIANMKVLDND